MSTAIAYLLVLAAMVPICVWAWRNTESPVQRRRREMRERYERLSLVLGRSTIPAFREFGASVAGLARMLASPAMADFMLSVEDAERREQDRQPASTISDGLAR